MSIDSVFLAKTKSGVTVRIPRHMWGQQGYMKGDSFIVSLENKNIKLTPIVRMSRLQREWNKYMRRMKHSDLVFDVYRAKKCIGKLIPDNFSLIKQTNVL